MVPMTPKPPCCEDLDGDGVVNGADLGAMLNAWGNCPSDPCDEVNCDDGDPCTSDSCVDGNCFNEKIPGCGEGPCGDPSAGSCTASNGSPGCDDATCCNLICNDDPYCCETEWDSLCSGAANANCNGGGGGEGVCGEGSGSCSEPNGSPGCENEGCCELICANDPFCCTTEWDFLCVEAAEIDCQKN